MAKDSFLSKLKDAKIKKKRLTIYLTEEMAKKLKLYAAQHDKTISETVEDALALKLQNAKTSKR